MSITIKRNPAKYAPVYNPLILAVDSTNKNNAGFAYLFDVYSGSSSSGQLITRHRVPPSPEAGYGFLDLRTILDAYTSYEQPDGSEVFTQTPSHWAPYTVEFGESFSHWEFSSVYNSGGLLAFLSSDPHNFIAGQTVVIRQDLGYGSGNQYIEGQHVVASVSSNLVVTTTSYNASTSTSTGRIIHNDGAAVAATGLTSIGEYYAYNGSFDRSEWNVYDTQQWIAVAQNGNRALTNVPNNFRVRTEDSGFLSCFSKLANNLYRVVVVTSGATGEVLGSYNFYNPYSALTSQYIQVPLGLQQYEDLSAFATVSFGSLPIITDDVKSYGITLANNNILLGKKYVFQIEEDAFCQGYPVTRLVFRDRKGSQLGFNFPYKEQERRSIERKTFRSVQPAWKETSPYYNSDLSKRGATEFTIDQKITKTVYTAFLTEEEAQYYVQDFLTSRDVYEVQTDGSLLPVVLPNINAEVKKRYNGLIQYSLSYTYANDEDLYR